MSIRYNSKKDAWLVAVIVVALLLSFIPQIFVLMTPEAMQQGAWVSLVVTVVVWVFVASLIWPLYYEITPSELFIRSGLLHWKIPLASIQRVSPTRNLLASPSLSLDRLRVDYSQNGKARYTLISPKDKPGFLRDLAQYAGDLEVRGEGVVRLA